MVVGASGTIGGAICAELEQRGAEVIKHGRAPITFEWGNAPTGFVYAAGDYLDMHANFARVVDAVWRLRTAAQGAPLRIVLIGGGGVGSGNYPKERAEYVACKFGVAGYVEALAHDLSDGQRINCVAPGPIKSRMTAGEERNDWVEPELCARMVARLVLDDEAPPVSGKLFSARTGQAYNLRSVSL